MFGLFRTLSLLIFLGMAAGVPYLYFQATDSDLAKRVKGWFARSEDSTRLELDGEGSASLTGVSARGTEAPRAVSIDNVFRFAWTPQQVIQTWPQVTRVYDGDWLGLRVALVTGTTSRDLAGSLTYYFDSSNQVRRITFWGTTGDARPLVQVATSRFRLKPEPTTSAGLFVTRWNGKPRSALRMTYPPVLAAKNSRQQVEVMLEINHPSSPRYQLSKDFQKILEQDRLVGRWKPF